MNNLENNKHKNLYIDLKENSYNILIGYGTLDNVEEHISKVFGGKKILIITDDNVINLYGNSLSNILKNNYIVETFVFPNGEPSKTLSTCTKVYNKLTSMNFSRTDLIIALGGGVVGDLAGFVSATYLRGVSFVQIPTTLLAQVDSSIGGKVAVDMPEGKNLVGAFYQPKLVIIDCNVLSTLPTKFFNDGMGEIIKYSMISNNIIQNSTINNAIVKYDIIKDKSLFCKLSSFKNKTDLINDIDDIVYTCCNIKKLIVENDVFDTGERIILNFGHTLAHAIEKICNYEKITHGEAVSIGMNIITKISEEKNLTQIGTQVQLEQILKKYDLPYSINNEFLKENKQDIINAILLDKKNLNNALNLVLLKNIGNSFVYKTDVNFFNNIF